MADSVIQRGKDACIIQDDPNNTRNMPRKPRLTASEFEVFVSLPLGDIRGRTIASAVLTVPTVAVWLSQTVTAWRITDSWSTATVTWNRKAPVSTSDEIVALQPALAAGDLVEIDVTDHVQLAANGTDFYGWKLTTDSAAVNHVWGFSSPETSWVLTIEFSDAPEQPTDLSPDGGAVAVKPVLQWDFEDFGGDSTEQGASKVQVNATAPDDVSPDYDSGWQTNGDPQWDMAATAWAGVSSGTEVFWRVQVRDGAGIESEWSDWASYTYRTKPTLSLTNPGTGVLWDPSPTIAAELSGATATLFYRIRVTKGTDKTKILFDSGKVKNTVGTDIDYRIPAKDPHTKKVIFKDDATYWLNVRAWDRTDREPTPGDKGFIEVWEQVTFDDDLTPQRPTTLVVAQIGDSPRVRATWVRPSGVELGWVLERQADDGSWERVARMLPEGEDDPDAVEQVGTSYSWVYNGARPFAANTFRVRAIDDSTEKQTAPSDSYTVTPEPKGVWLLGEAEGNEVCLDGLDVGGFKTVDRRSSYRPLNLPYDIDIVHAFEGVTGSFTGSFDSRQDWEESRRLLLAMKEASATPVQLAYGTTSVPVILRNVTVAPSPGFLPNNMQHDVSFEAMQVDDFEVSV